MKIIHTGDWHVGKLLADKSRLEEQKIVLDELVQMAETHQPDVICVTGDIYDNGHPSAKAEELFCSTIKKLSGNGSRLVVIIAGNHDQPERLEALSPLAKEHGILIFGTQKSEVPTGDFGKYHIVSHDRGVFEVQIGEETAMFACVPYASEKHLGEVIYQDMETEEEHLKSYEGKMKSIYDSCDTYFREDTVNICLSHVFTVGYEGDSSERSTQLLGGSFLLDASVFPSKADYVALGHVHKPQRVAGTQGRVRYSGSILPYHSDEVKIAKQCYLVELHPHLEAEVTSLTFSNPKPIERWKCMGYEEARQKCEENQERSCWVFLRIHTDQAIREDQIKELKKIKDDILEITPVFSDQEYEEEEQQMIQEQNIMELFKNFYFSEKNVEPDEEILMLLQSLVGEESE